MQKLAKFGAFLIAGNIAYCVIMAIIQAYETREYVFLSDYFVAASLLIVTWIAIEHAKGSVWKKAD